MNAYLFSGQGSQKEKMGFDIYNNFSAAAKIYEQAHDFTGLDILNLNEEQLKQTRFAQLAIVVMSLASWSAWQENLNVENTDLTVEKSAFAGFSLGEYSALAAAGVIGLKDLLELVSIRSELMQKASSENPGAMYAILGLDFEKIEELLQKPEFKNQVFPVNYNCPGQLVISGLKEAAENAASALKSAGAKRCLPLNVSGAFHTVFMNSAAQELKKHTAGITFAKAKGKVFSNIDGKLIDQDIDWSEYLSKHLCSPVKWTQEIANMNNSGYDKFLEMGYGKVLTGMVKKIDRNLTVMPVQDKETLEAAI